MTDFLYDGYRKRCWKEIRDVAEIIKDNPETIVDELKVSNKDYTHPIYQKFQMCLFSPLVKNEIRDAILNCLQKNKGEILKCPNSFSNFKGKGSVELGDLLNHDNHGLIKTGAVRDQCEIFIKETKKLQCYLFPEKSECSELKQKAFSCISKVACNELFEASTKCFYKQDFRDKNSIFYGIFYGDNDITAMQMKKRCDIIHMNYLNCFEKYFFLAQLMQPNGKLKVEFGPNPPLFGYRKENIKTNNLTADDLITSYTNEKDD